MSSALALALAACTGGASSAAPVPSPFDEARAFAHLERIVGFGPRTSGSPAIEELRGYLEAELAACGLEPEREDFQESTPVGELEFANVWADITRAPSEGGAPVATRMIVIATHFDTKRFPFPFVGANDGGSGTAILLELARVLAARRDELRADYRLLFLDGEEATRLEWEGDDNRYGSRFHVETLRKAKELDRVGAFVLLDLVGDADLRLFRESLSHPELMELFADAARGIGLARHVDGPRLEIKDDHLSFLAAGVPSVDLIDFEYGPGNEYWHSAEDTLDKVSAASLGITGRIVLAGLPALEEWVIGRRR